MKALSIRQPWAWLILHAGKNIENRDWSTRVRGRVLIHASRGMTTAEYEAAARFARLVLEQRMKRWQPMSAQRSASITLRGALELPSYEDLERGGIVGSVEIMDCVGNSVSPWFVGRHGFVLRDPQPLPFRPLRGQLGFFEVEGY